MVVLVLGSIVPGRWEKVVEARGEIVTVVLKRQDRLDGRLKDIVSDGIVLVTEGRELRIPKDDILRIEGMKRIPDSIKDGLAAGIVGGFLLGALFIGLPEAMFARSDRQLAGALLKGGAIGTGVGALIGGVIDANWQDRQVIYQSPIP